jgi:hypothetical protein
VLLGMMPLHLKQWPHEGPMLMREGSGHRVQYHVIDGWQHLATFDGDDAAGVEEYCSSSRRPRLDHFDIDGYRILTRHLADARLTPLPRRVDESWS